MPHASLFDCAHSNTRPHTSGQALDDHHRLSKIGITAVGGVGSIALHGGGKSISGDGFIAVLCQRLWKQGADGA